MVCAHKFKTILLTVEIGKSLYFKRPQERVYRTTKECIYCGDRKVFSSYIPLDAKILIDDITKSIKGGKNKNE